MVFLLVNGTCPCFSCPRSSLYLLSLFLSFRVPNCHTQSWLWPNTPPSAYTKRKLNSYSLRSSPLHKGFPIAIGAHCVGERSSEPVPRLNSEFFRSYRLAMPVASYLVGFVFWQALYGRRCPTVMSTVSRCMSRFVRDNHQDTGVTTTSLANFGECPECELRRYGVLRSSAPEIATKTGDATALGLVGIGKEGKDALVHPPEDRLRGDVAAAFEELGQGKVGEDLFCPGRVPRRLPPRPLEGDPRA